MAPKRVKKNVGKHKADHKTHFCIACARSHSSPTWYGKSGSKVCKAEYEKQRRLVHNYDLKNKAVNLSGSSSWRAKLLPQIGDKDRTNYAIESLQQRPDYNALRLALHPLAEKGSPAWLLWFYGAWCVFLYWSWPCLSFIANATSQNDQHPKIIQSCFDSAVDMFQQYRIVDGELVPHRAGSTARGLRAVGRDMDRGNSIPRGRDLCREADAWKSICKKLCRLPSPFSVKAGMDIMREGGLHSMRGDNDAYGCLGVLRLLASVLHENNFADSEPDWLELRAMSKGVQEKLKSFQLWEHKDAVSARNTLRKVLNSRRYSLSDLVCFVCLSK